MEKQDKVFECNVPITFADDVQDGRAYWQNVLMGEDIIGAICQLDGPVLKPVTVFYQRLVPDTAIPHPLIKAWYTAEDEGFIFAKFDTLQELVDYHLEITANTAKLKLNKRKENL